MNKKIKNKKDDEFWSYGSDGARKRDYSILEMQKQNFPLWRKILRVTFNCSFTGISSFY